MFVSNANGAGAFFACFVAEMQLTGPFIAQMAMFERAVGEIAVSST